MSRARASLWRAYREPLLLALVSVGGLLSALIGDGPFDLFSWLTLGALIVIIASKTRRR